MPQHSQQTEARRMYNNVRFVPHRLSGTMKTCSCMERIPLEGYRGKVNKAWRLYEPILCRYWSHEGRQRRTGLQTSHHNRHGIPHVPLSIASSTPPQTEPSYIRLRAQSSYSRHSAHIRFRSSHDVPHQRQQFLRGLAAWVVGRSAPSADRGPRRASSVHRGAQ